MAQLDLAKVTDSHRKAFEKAMVEFRESQELSLDHAGGHLVMASFDRQHGRIEDAIQHLVDAIKLEPYLAGLLEQNWPHSCRSTRGTRPKSKNCEMEEADLVERDSKLAPENADIFYRLALMRYTLGDYDKAETAFRMACASVLQNYEYLMALVLLRKDLHPNRRERNSLTRPWSRSSRCTN